MTGMALAALLDDTEARNDWSDRAVIAQAARAGCTLTRQDITNYRHIGMKHINPDKVKALAAGLQLPPYRVVQAVLTDHGIGLPFDVRTPEEAVAHDHTLSAATRRALLAILNEARSAD